MNHYEGLFIIKPDLNDDSVKGIHKTLGELVVKSGGTVKKEEIWGKRALAYPVKKFKEGNYYKLDFEAPSDAVSKVEAACKLNGDIIRAMISRR
jgi:small subunit ribosomal protein S6